MTAACALMVRRERKRQPVAADIVREALSYSAVAQVPEIPLGTVLSHLACGRNRLRHIPDSHTLAACGEPC
jgi:DNA-directed RNA polymerase specialized sigma24 family protein